jgi:hypothetical protein
LQPGKLGKINGLGYASIFRLIGAPPGPVSKEVRDFLNENLDTWRQIEVDHSLRTDIAISDVTLSGFEVLPLRLVNFDRQFDMSKMKKVGFHEECTSIETWATTFERMKKAKMIPSS